MSELFFDDDVELLAADEVLVDDVDVLRLDDCVAVLLFTVLVFFESLNDLVAVDVAELFCPALVALLLLVTLFTGVNVPLVVVVVVLPLPVLPVEPPLVAVPPLVSEPPALVVLPVETVCPPPALVVLPPLMPPFELPPLLCVP